MTFRLTRFVLCGCLVAACGCQNPLSRTAKFPDTDSLETRFSLSSDDPSPLGRGHLPSLASELANHRRESAEAATGIPGGSSLTVKRLLERGHDADAHGRAQEARMYYEQVLAEEADHPEAHHRLAILADQAGDYRSAEQHYLTALRGKPHDADVLNDLGYSYFLQGQAAQSERYLNQALQIAPRHPHVQENLSLLYDQAKAEKVLLSLMGPRQTQATLARLFQNAPGNPPVPKLPPQSQFAQRPTMSNPQPNYSDNNATDEEQLPEDLKVLQRKMEEARMRSIAKRRKQKSPQYPARRPDRMANGAALPSPYPPNAARRQLLGGLELPDGRINDAFRNIDAGGHSRGVPSRNPGLAVNRATQVPVRQFDSPATPPRRLPPMHAQPMIPRTADGRAAAPQWNTPPQQWPHAPRERFAPQGIEQTHHTQPSNSSTQAVARPTRPSAAERAAEIGMSAGLGAMFPQWNSEEAEPSQHSPAPAMRSMPGTHSRMNGTLYRQPAGSGVPSDWDTFNTSAGNPSQGGQPASQFESQHGQSGLNSRGFQPQNPAIRGDSAGVDSYDQMRKGHNAQFNRDQQSLAANPSLMTSGPPGHQPIPGGFDPNRQDWPAYTRDQYDTRNMNPPPTEPQQPGNGAGQFDGQIVPQYNPSTQSAPQNYGRRW